MNNYYGYRSSNDLGSAWSNNYPKMNPYKIQAEKIARIQEFERDKQLEIEKLRKLPMWGIAGFCTFEVSVILYFSCQEIEVKKQFLIIKECKRILNASPDDLLNIIENYLNEHPNKPKVFMNPDYISREIYYWETIDFDVNAVKKADVRQAQNLYRYLMYNDRIKRISNVSMNIEDSFTMKALLTAIFGLKARISGDRDKYEIPKGNPTLPVHYQDGYQGTYLNPNDPHNYSY